MPNQILQVDENMLETKLDRLVSEKVEQLLNAMLDAEADEITGACRRSYTLECKTNAARRALEGEPLARVARDAGCTPTSVYQWMRRYRSEGILGLMDRRNAPMPAEPMPAAGDDVEELRRQGGPAAGERGDAGDDRCFKSRRPAPRPVHADEQGEDAGRRRDQG